MHTTIEEIRAAVRQVIREEILLLRQDLLDALREPEPGRAAYRVAEVAELLGSSDSSVYRWISEGAVPTVDLDGSKTMLIPAWWVKEHQAPPNVTEPRPKPGFRLQA